MTTVCVEMLLLLLSYFDEKEESLFFYVDDTCLAEEVQLEQVPLTPALIVCGKYASNKYVLIALFKVQQGGHCHGITPVRGIQVLHPSVVHYSTITFSPNVIPYLAYDCSAY